MTAVEVTSRGFHREIDVTEFEIRAHGSPYGSVACVLPGIVAPRVVAVVIRTRHGVESPDQFAGARVISANIPWDIRFGFWRRPGEKRAADNHDVANNDRWRRGSDLIRFDLAV